MSKFMNQEDRSKAIKELMASIRNITVSSKCIETFGELLEEVTDKDFVDTVIVDMCRYISDFSRLCKDIDMMDGKDFISKMLTPEFIDPYPHTYFKDSRKQADLHYNMNLFLGVVYNLPPFNEGIKRIVSSETSIIGDLCPKVSFSFMNKANIDVATMTKLEWKFGTMNDLSVEKVAEMSETARKVVLLYNHIPAVIKAMIQTKRRELNMDTNSQKFN